MRPRVTMAAVAGTAFLAGRRTRSARGKGRRASASGTYPSDGASPQQGATQPGAGADSPTEIPAQGWKQVLKRAWAEQKSDNIGFLSAGVAYYAFTALFPALIAVVTTYGLVASPSDVQRQLASITDKLPQDAASLITTQLKNVASGSGGALSIGLAVSILGALFSASGGVGNVIKAINIAYDEDETRGAIKLRAIALALTLGAVLFVIVAIGLVGVLPVVLNAFGLGAVGKILVGIAQWVGLVVFMMVALAVLYRYAPDRDAPKFRWVSPGAVVSTVLWIVASAALSIYVSNFGSYGKTYGALAGVIVLLLWLYVTAFIVLLGAEINAEAEAQTAKDSTKGPAKPMGERRALKADTVAR